MQSKSNYNVACGSNHQTEFYTRFSFYAQNLCYFFIVKIGICNAMPFLFSMP